MLASCSLCLGGVAKPWRMLLGGGVRPHGWSRDSHLAAFDAQIADENAGEKLVKLSGGYVETICRQHGPAASRALQRAAQAPGEAQGRFEARLASANRPDGGRLA